MKALLGTMLGLAGGAGAAQDGGQALAFAKLPVGARPAALGNAYGAVGGDAYGLATNVALLTTLKDLRIGTQWASLPTGRNQQYLAFGRQIDAGGETAYGLSFNRSALDTGIEKRLANTPDPDSIFNESASIFTVGLASWLWPQKLSAGVGVKVLAQSLGEASSGGFSADLGFYMRTWDWLDLGISLQDLSSRLTWNTGLAESIPLVMRASSAIHTVDGRVLFSVDIEKSQAQEIHPRLGLEFWAWPKALALRAGLSQGQWATGLGLRSGLFGLKVDAGLDYALVADPLGDGALQHRFSLDLGFLLD